MTGGSDPRRKIGWHQVRTGVVLLCSILGAAALVFFLDEIRRALAAGPAVTVVAEEARDLAPGSDVWVAGRPGGRVTGVTFRSSGGERSPVTIRARLRRDAAAALRADAEARVRRSGLFGPAVLALDPGSPDAPPFDASETLVARDEPGAAEIRGRIDELREELEGAEHLARRLGERMRDGPGTLASLRRDTLLLGRLAERADEVRALARRARGGSAARLLRDRRIRRSLESVLARAREIGRSLAGRDAPRALGGELRELGRRLDRIAARIEAAEGTVGRALRDGELLVQLRLVRARADSVRAELAADPRRWLRIRLF